MLISSHLIVSYRISSRQSQLVSTLPLHSILHYPILFYSTGHFVSLSLTLVVTHVATAMLRAAKAEDRSAPDLEKFMKSVLQGEGQLGDGERRRRDTVEKW
jgi:hypothetical protein